MPHPLDEPNLPEKMLYSVGVVAPRGFNPPGLSRFVRNKLRQLLTNRRRDFRIGVWGVWGQPVFVAASDMMQAEFQTNAGGAPGGRGRGPFVDHLRECIGAVAIGDAVVAFHAGGPLPPEMLFVLEVCKRVRAPSRVFAFGGDAVPL